MARRQRNTLQPIQNPPFHHKYDNPPKNPFQVKAQSENPRRILVNLLLDFLMMMVKTQTLTWTLAQFICQNLNLNLNTRSQAKTCQLPHSVHGFHFDKQEAPRVTIKGPDQFDGSNQKRLWRFLLQLRLVFWAKKRSFKSNSDKVTYAL